MIPVGIVVTVASTVNLNACPDTYLWIKGELHFLTGKKLELSCGSAVYIDGGPPPGRLTKGGGGGASNTIKICGVTYWSASDGDVTGPSVFCADCFLPVELLYFTAEPKLDAVYLSWSTASEINNSHFIIQRSADGINWADIAILQGAGSSSREIKYNFKDLQYLNGISYYRLVQVDFDGELTYHDRVSVDYGSEDIRVYPNPIRQGESVTIQANTAIKSFEIYTLLGESLNTNQFVQLDDYQNKFTFRCDLPTGHYVLLINGASVQLIVYN